MHRLGVVVGAVSACVAFVRQLQERPLQGVEDFLAVVVFSLVPGVFVWLVFLATGWAIRGFLAD